MRQCNTQSSKSLERFPNSGEEKSPFPGFYGVVWGGLLGTEQIEKQNLMHITSPG